jgi:hypothetical protein
MASMGKISSPFQFPHTSSVTHPSFSLSCHPQKQIQLTPNVAAWRSSRDAADASILVLIVLSHFCGWQTRPWVPVQYPSGQTSFPSVSIFIFEVTRNDDRLPLAYAGLHSLLTHMRPARFQYSATIFIYNSTLPDSDCDDIRFLRSIHKEINVKFRWISMGYAIERTEAKFPLAVRVRRGQFRMRDIAFVRMYVPLLYEADWFFYQDDDIEYRRGEIFPEVMDFTSDRSKVLFAVRDYAFIVLDRFRKRTKRCKSVNNVTSYYGSGFLLMRSSEILRHELRNTIAYYGRYPELRFPDQDALNLGFDFSYVSLLPVRFCVVLSEWKKEKDRAYGFHCTSCAKTPKSGFMARFVGRYRYARDAWLRGQKQ